ncbi:hypothetical protein BDB00DRAFT_835303 [Zychaea mexicana]|uniref:uncharacterized protein n=1 Tax=Zychaea mexicana TaxID=64656 RepID=UPI0022FE0DA4|nr:uncharacterized protein BDB00DRAFT_835303 [Zychaea mexicana]KAI9490958.1 hypothetical protein BDB00DRAFT_835303 [Zychaea mexicana]
MTKPNTRIPSSASMRSSENADIASRKRQSRKDEAIRKKLENELSRKKSGSSRLRHNRSKQVAGTVSALKPMQALTVSERMLVIEAAQLMAAKRSDCVLVVDEEDHLSGIFTAKDLAYRVVAESLDARATSVAQIMTKGPMCVTSDTSATDALNLMVARGFRHLPVCNEEGDIFGLLDITKCLYEALDKMERAYGSSRKLYDALEGMEREWNSSPVQLVQYMETLRDRMSCPDLNTVLDGSKPAEVSVKKSVREVTRMMKDFHTTAVLVVDKHGLSGIITTKDVVLRVVAQGLNPDTCSVVRVMTPHPDTATPHTTILEALRRMHDGHYLNLPVLEDGAILGIVDVLKLTYATLEQIHSIQGNDGEGPMWSRFWDSFGDGDNESQTSDPAMSSQPTTVNSHLRNVAATTISPEPPRSPFPEITPNESASMVAHSENRRNSSHHDDARSSMSASRVTSSKDLFAFKFTAASGKTHRFMSPNNSFSELDRIVHEKLTGEYDGAIHIYYVDDDKDEVLVTSDTDVIGAVQLAERMGWNRVLLKIGLEVAENKRRSMQQQPKDNHSRHDRNPRKSLLRQDMMLPAAITFLGAVIIGVVAFSKTSSNNRY